MKKLCACILAALTLAGCAGKSDGMERSLALRSKLLGCNECSFEAKITADYGDALHVFSMTCRGDNTGNLEFEVNEPESISGITGKFEAGKGALTFDDTALAFPLLTDDQVTPVSAPWIFYKTLLGGYLTSCGADGDYLRITVNDSYEEDALQLDIWLNTEDAPVRAEILYDGRRIVSMDIADFQIS